MTPRWALLFFLAVALAFSPGVARAERPRTDDPTPARAIPAGPVLDVEAFMEGNHQGGGLVRIRGLVGDIRPDRKLLSLVDLSDREELLEAGKTKCMTLPVRWSGAMPALHQAVLAEGRVQKEGGKLVFVATSLAPLPARAPQ